MEFVKLLQILIIFLYIFLYYSYVHNLLLVQSKTKEMLACYRSYIDLLEPVKNYGDTDAAEKQEASEEELPTINVGPISTFKLLFESIFKPVSKVPNNARAIDDAIDSGKLVIFSTIYVIIFAIIGAVVSGFFVKRYDLTSGLYNTYLDFGNVINVKFVDVILSAGAISLLLTLVTAIVYYIISFFRSKGVTLGSYISLCSLALFPLYFGIFTLYPILSIFSYFAGFFILIVSFIFSLLSLFNGITTMIKFDKENNKIFYNIFTMSIVVLILIGIIMVFFQNDFNSIVNIINAM